MTTSQPGVTPLPGDWAVCKVTGPGNKVEWMQRLSGGGRAACEYVHAVYLVAPGIIVEAVPSGARRVPVHYPAATLWWSTGLIPKTDAARIKSIAAANSYADRKTGYSYLDYAAIGLHAWHIPAPGLRGYIASTGHEICSQLVDQIELDGGTHLFNDGRWPGYVRPLDLADLLGAP